MSSLLPDRLTRQLAGHCCYGACTETAVEGSDYCPPHDAHEKGRARTRIKRHRQKLADKGRCITGCGTKVGKKPRADGSIQQRRCAECSRLHREAERARGVTDESSGVTGDEQIPAKRGRIYIEEREGLQSIARYVGRDRKGAPSREELDEELKHELSRALGELQAVRDRGISMLRSERVTELGRAAKKEAAVELADRVLRVSRICRAAADNLAPGRAAELDEEMRIATDATE